jgi:hypothetical protein
MLSYKFEIGQQLFNNISKETFSLLITNGGYEALRYNRKYFKSFGFGYYKYMAYKYAAENSQLRKVS